VGCTGKIVGIESEVSVIGGARATDRGDEAQTEKFKESKGSVQCFDFMLI